MIDPRVGTMEMTAQCKQPGKVFESPSAVLPRLQLLRLVSCQFMSNKEHIFDFVIKHFVFSSALRIKNLEEPLSSRTNQLNQKYDVQDTRENIRRRAPRIDLQILSQFESRL